MLFYTDNIHIYIYIRRDVNIYINIDICVPVASVQPISLKTYSTEDAEIILANGTPAAIPVQQEFRTFAGPTQERGANSL